VTHFVTKLVQHGGYFAIFVLMLAESACIPFPSEATMLFGGAVSAGAIVGASHHLNFVMVGLIGTLGNLVGSWVAYGVGRAGGRPLIERWGRYVLLRPHDIDRAEAWFDEHGEAAVFFSRLLPVVRTFISLPAGVAEMPFGRFTLYTVAGCLPWTFALAGIGYAVGSNWHTIERYIALIGVILAILLVAGIVVWVWRRLGQRESQRTRR
jgi:membrane protein DedA with SNARE-associated domain